MYYRTVLQQCTRGYRRTTTTSTTATTANSSASSQSHVVGQKKEYARSLIPLIAAVQMHRVDNILQELRGISFKGYSGLRPKKQVHENVIFNLFNRIFVVTLNTM